MQTELLKVTGMTCGGCVSSVTSALKAIAGVEDVKVSLADSEARVQYDERVASTKQLRSAVEGAGFGLASIGSAKAPKEKGGCCG